MSAPQVFVGIDVAKAHLDMALRPTGERWAVTNEAPGIAALVAQLQATQPTLMVLEATGGSPRAVVAALAAVALPSWWSIPARSGTLRKPPGSWPQPRRLMPAPWPTVRRPAGRRCARCQTRRRKSCGPSWRAGGNASPCGPPRRTASSMCRLACGPTSKPLVPGSISAWRPWMMTWTRRSGQAPSGASARPCTAGSQALDPCVRGRWYVTCRSWAPEAASASRRSSASPPSIGTVAPCGGPARPGVDAPMSGRPWT